MTNRWLTVGAVLAVAGCALAQNQNNPNPSSTRQPSAVSQAASESGRQAQPFVRPDYMPRLMVGDKAPGLFIDTWVKGSPISGLEKGKVYLVEFWATWCLPCRDSMDHLTRVQARYKDRGLTVIGISSSERNGLEDVVPFVNEMGDRMGYTVAWDDGGKTDAAWRKAAGQTGIPSAFIVDRDGFIAWVGHPAYPAGEMDEVLSQVLSNTFDLSLAADRERAGAEMMHRAQVLWSEGEYRLALDVLGGLVTLNPKRYSSAALQKMQGLLVQLKDTEAGYAWANELIDTHYSNNAGVLTEIAWTILEAPGLEQRDLSIAFRAAQRAFDLTKGEDPAALDTLARVHFARGNTEEAFALQTRAAELVTDERMKDLVNGRLEQYRQAVVETK